MSAVTEQEASTFAGLWIEHQPKYRVVVAFTRDAARTLSKYTRDPLFEPLDRPGPTLAALRATQERLTRELTAINARPSYSSSSEQTGRVEIGLAVEADIVRSAQKAGRINIPGYVDLIPPRPLRFNVPPPFAGDARLHAFPRAYYRRGELSTMMPSSKRKIIVYEGCLSLQGEDGPRTILWSNEAAVDRSQNGVIAIVDRENGARVAVGEDAALESSAIPKGWSEPVIDTDPRCPGPYMFIASFETWAGYRDRVLQAQAEGIARDQKVSKADALAGLRRTEALTERLAALAPQLSKSAPDRFGGLAAYDGKATLYLMGGEDARLLVAVPADLRPLITTVAVPRPLAVLQSKRQKLRDQLEAIGIEARVGWDIQAGRLTLTDVSDLRGLAQAAQTGQVNLSPDIDLTTDGATLAGSYIPDALEVVDRAAEAAPDFAVIRTLIEATPVPAILAGGGETDPPRKPSRVQSLDIARFLVTLGFTADRIRALQAAGIDPVNAWVRQNGFATPANQAVLARETVVVEPVRTYEAQLGDGYRSTVVLRVIESLKGDARSGDLLTMRMVSGREGDAYVQANEEPPLLAGLPGAMTTGTRWMLNLSDGFYSRSAALVGGKNASPAGSRWYVSWSTFARVEGDRVLSYRSDEQIHSLDAIRREIAPVDEAFDRLPATRVLRSDPPPSIDDAMSARAKPVAEASVSDAGLQASDLDLLFNLAIEQAGPSFGAMCFAIQPLDENRPRDVPQDLLDRFGVRFGLPAYAASQCGFHIYPFVKATRDRATLYTARITRREGDGSLIVMLSAAIANLGSYSAEYRLSGNVGARKVIPTGIMVVS
ncbi:hypothetical protein [Novosphingobium sp. JCM 18896]|uniref:hypothetical protein n=1 Tax=Novosphingobium sp. JCM 18896 TaxID=2989731 RepID=UPI0022234BC1|nr:hypothetical protein [Novosphingobium sp. JCM 18896]MCW1431604.1 hypothetical protein [Novosphingobium sp. JCM 18896]